MIIIEACYIKKFKKIYSSQYRPWAYTNIVNALGSSMVLQFAKHTDKQSRSTMVQALISFEKLGFIAEQTDPGTNHIDYFNQLTSMMLKLHTILTLVSEIGNNWCRGCTFSFFRYEAFQQGMKRFYITRYLK